MGEATGHSLYSPGIRNIVHLLVFIELNAESMLRGLEFPEMVLWERDEMRHTHRHMERIGFEMVEAGRGYGQD